MVKDLDVFLKSGHQRLFVGRLSYSIADNRSLFEYDGSFLGSGFSISPIQLPLDTGVFRADRPKYPDDPLYGLHGVFADSLPDTWGRKVQDLWFQKIGIVNPHPFDRLAYVGDFAMGALSYEPALKIKNSRKNITELSGLRKAAIGIQKGNIESVTGHLNRMGGSAGGMHPKFLVGFNPHTKMCTYGTVLEDSEVPAIVKVPVDSSEETQKTEYLYSSMARLAHIDIPTTYLIECKKLAYYLIERFDIQDDGTRNHVHTMAGMMGINYADRTIDYRQAFRLTHGLTRDIRQLEQLYRRMVFNLLSGNQDDHAKNMSYIMDCKGTWRLAPAYDLTFSRTTHGTHSMSINGSVAHHSLKDLEVLAGEFGIKTWQEILDSVRESLQQWPRLASSVDISSKTKDLVFKSILDIDGQVF